MRDADGEPLTSRSSSPASRCAPQVWRLRSAACRCYLLDTDVDGNSPGDRPITEHALRRRPRARGCARRSCSASAACARCAALGHRADRLPHERGPRGVARARAAARRSSPSGPRRRARRSSACAPRRVFTTHTPVPAGQRRFEPELVRALPRRRSPRTRAHAGRSCSRSGARPGDDPLFGMTPLALRTAACANGVARAPRRGRARDVARALARRAATTCRSAHVTNGVHPGTWIAPSCATCSLRPASDLGAPPAWQALGARRRELDARVLAARRRPQASLLGEVAARGPTSRPDALTIGFARRFATYKRADLLLSDAERLRRLLDDPDAAACRSSSPARRTRATSPARS